MPDTNQNILVTIGSEYYNFTASEKKVCDYVLGNQDSSAYLSISELAAACGVAEATVTRFCRRLGCKGYNAFKLSLANASAQHKSDTNPLSGEITPEDDLPTICQKLLVAETQAMSQTMEVLSAEAVARAATYLEKAGRVLCMGQGGSMLMASEAAHLFSTVSNKFTPISDAHMQAMAVALIEKGDVVFFFSYSGSTTAMIDTLQLAKDNGGIVILVTRFPNSPGAKLADVVLQCGANENPIQSGSIAARIAQLYLLDVLFSEYSHRNMEEAFRTRSRIANALADTHF